MQSKGNFKHGFSKTKLYYVWEGMRKRCTNTKAPPYKNYGGRGIKVCEEWNNYLNFHVWATNNGYVQGLTIDRINNDGNYEPSNCRWVSYEIQNSNKRMSGLNKTGVVGVCLIKNGSTYQANIEKDGIAKTKSFSVNKYGVEESFRLAVDWRKEEEKLNT